MNFYWVMSSRRKNREQVLSAFRQAIGRLLPGVQEIDGAALLAQDSNLQLFLTKEDTNEIIWSRIFLETLTHASFDSLEEQFHEIQGTFRKLMGPESKLQAFVFFPSLAKGISESFSRLPQDWHFFEYFFLRTEDHEAFALKEHIIRPVLNEENGLNYFDHSDDENKHFIRRTCLSRDELAGLIELSLNLKDISSSS